MATDGLRRSTRVRTQVKTYAEEQAEERESVSKRKRKSTRDDDESNEADVKPVKKTRKTKKTAKSDESDDDTTASNTAKKAAKASSSKPKRTATNRSWHGDAAERRIAVANRNVRRLAEGQEEVRLRSYVDDPPKSYRDALKRANTQKMFILDRERGIEDDCHANRTDCPCETIQIAGSTGNVYTVTISHLPSCTCPAGIFKRKGEEKLCKHALYVLHNVLKAPAHLKQQDAFLTSELKEIFANAPSLPGQIAEDERMDGNRKPVEDDCPICCMEFEEGEEISWCRAACGNNIHTACFEQWARTKAGHVTCPFCRTAWDYGEPTKTQKVNVASIEIPASRGRDGYRNVRDQLDYD